MTRHVSQKPAALKDLAARKRAFLKHYVRSGDAAASYAKAGYKATHRATLSRVSRLKKELAPYMDLAFKEYITGVEMGMLGVKVIRDLALTAESEQVKLNAAKELKALAIKEDPTEQVVTHVHKQLSNEDLDKRLLELQDELFIAAPKAEVVDISDA